MANHCWRKLIRRGMERLIDSGFARFWGFDSLSGLSGGGIVFYGLLNIVDYVGDGYKALYCVVININVELFLQIHRQGELLQRVEIQPCQRHRRVYLINFDGVIGENKVANILRKSWVLITVHNERLLIHE